MQKQRQCPDSTNASSHRSLLTLILAAMVSTAGCSHYAAVEIESDPQGAEVVNMDTGVTMGTTPLKYWWETTSSERQFINVRFQKPGYRDKPSAFYTNPRHKSHIDALKDPHYIKVILDKAD